MTARILPLFLIATACAPQVSETSAPPQSLAMPSAPAEGAEPDAAAGAASIRRDDVAHMVAAEEWILTLGDAFGALKRDLRGLRLPGRELRPHLADAVQVGTLIGEGERTFGPLDVGSRHVLHADPSQPVTDGSPWWPLLDELFLLDRVQVGVLDAEYRAEPEPTWHTRLKIVASGLARGAGGGGATIGLTAKVDTRWTPTRQLPGFPVDGPWFEGGEWRLAAFDTLKLEVTAAPETLFESDLAEFVADPDERDLLSTSAQDEIVIAHILDGEPLPEDFALASNPGLAVVDIDGDGFDDLYVMPRNRPNLLLVNDGRGRFAERAADFGLDLPGGCTSAAFADFDNDGDRDLLLGRVYEPSRYLVREGDRYVDATEALAPDLPTDVSAISVADFDGDGWLDAYFATYSAGPLLVERHSSQLMFTPTVGDGSEVFGLMGGHYFDLTGPANVLVLGRDGRLERQTDLGDGALAKHSFGASAADWDLDGDQDLYCSNDFAPDTLLRNDGGGRFTDVSDRIGAPMGFGMGAAWGDYDGDGRFDLYVSNMYSKAGSRIARRIPGLGAHVGESATGNFLLRNVDGDLVLTSDNLDDGEHGGDDQHVAHAGWSYCSQFVDLDNDGRLDIVAPNGFFSAPRAVARDEDW